MLAGKLLSRQIKDKKKIEKIIAFLCSDSGSHDYTIYRREARDELGLNVEKPNDEFYEIIKETYNDIKGELVLTRPFDPNAILGANPTAVYQARRVLIESVAGGTDVYLSEGTLNRQLQTMQQPGLPPIQNVVINDQRTFEGWRHE
jgi:hypothetical protein